MYSTKMSTFIVYLKIRVTITICDFQNVFTDIIMFLTVRGLPLITYAPRGKGGGQVSYTFSLRITCKKGGGGPKSM